MASKKPYFFRAILDWIIDGDQTPYLVVDATVPGVDVPLHLVEDGKIVLSISSSAVKKFFIENSYICFEASFSNRPTSVMVPMKAVRGLVSKETGDGLWFNEEDYEEDDSPPPVAREKNGKPKLQIIK